MPSVPCPGRSARRSSVPRDPLDVRGRPRCPRPPRARVERFRRLRDTSCGCSPSARPGTRPFRRNALVRLGPSRDRLSLDAVSRTTALPHRSLLRHRIDDQDRSVVAWNDPRARPPGPQALRQAICRIRDYHSGSLVRLTCAVAASVATLQDEIHSRRTSVFPTSARESSHEKSGSGCCSVRDTASGGVRARATQQRSSHSPPYQLCGVTAISAVLAQPIQPGHRAENEGACSPAATPTQPSMLPTSWRVDPSTEFSLTRWTLHSAI
jgi:hypothetical protein